MRKEVFLILSFRMFESARILELEGGWKDLFRLTLFYRWGD